MARSRSMTLARLLLVGSLVGAVVSTAPTRAQETEPAAADTIAPVLTQPANVLDVFAIDASGADVIYLLPDAVDETDGLLTADCSPASGSRFALGATTVTCAATDQAGNQGALSFLVTVTDLAPPVMQQPADIVLDDGMAAIYAVEAFDNVDGAIGATCDVPSGSLLPVGTTPVTCYATDQAGNPAAPVTFLVTVNALPTPTSTTVPTIEPTATDVPEPTDEPEPTGTPAAPDEPATTQTPEPTETPVPTETPTPTATATATATVVPTPPALDLPWPPPESFTLVGDGGPLDGLAMIWANGDYPISQEFGHTWFSVRHSSWYAYGRDYGLDGFEHTGLDIGMPRGAAIYSPVAGTVKVAGGTPYFTFYGNGQPGVGELLIETEDGHEVILGHMGLITVEAGDEVKVGELVGLSGGDNGDHLHLEVRERQERGGLRLVDPRRSFLIDVIEDAANANADAMSEAESIHWGRHGEDPAAQGISPTPEPVVDGS